MERTPKRGETPEGKISEQKPESITPPQQEGEKGKSDLNQVFQILSTNAEKGQQMMCDRMGDTLSFYTLFSSEQAAQDAHGQLALLNQKPKLDGRKIYLTAEFPGEEIDQLAKTFISIPNRGK